MASRLAARVLTGPLAFFAAAVFDIGAFIALALWHRALQRLRAALTAVRHATLGSR